MKTPQYLDALKKKLNLATDYALAKHFDIATATMSNYRNGKRAFDAEMSVRVAEILGVDAIQVIVHMELDRARSDEQRDLWKRIARKVATVAVVAIGAGAGAPVSEAAPSSAHAAVHTERLCIM